MTEQQRMERDQQEDTWTTIVVAILLWTVLFYILPN